MLMKALEMCCCCLAVTLAEAVAKQRIGQLPSLVQTLWTNNIYLAKSIPEKSPRLARMMHCFLFCVFFFAIAQNWNGSTILTWHWMNECVVCVCMQCMNWNSCCVQNTKCIALKVQCAATNERTNEHFFFVSLITWFRQLRLIRIELLKSIGNFRHPNTRTEREKMAVYTYTYLYTYFQFHRNKCLNFKMFGFANSAHVWWMCTMHCTHICGHGTTAIKAGQNPQVSVTESYVVYVHLTMDPLAS